MAYKQDTIVSALETALKALVKDDRAFTAEDAVQLAENKGLLQISDEKRGRIRIYVHAMWPILRDSHKWTRTVLESHPALPWVYHSNSFDLSQYKPVSSHSVIATDKNGRLTIPQFLLKKLGIKPKDEVVILSDIFEGQHRLVLDSQHPLTELNGQPTITATSDGRMRVGKQMLEEAGLEGTEFFAYCDSRNIYVKNNSEPQKK